MPQMSRSLSVNNNDHNSLLLYDTGYRSAECCCPCALQCVSGKRGRKDRRFKNMALMLMWKQLDCVALPVAWIASVSCDHVWSQTLYCNGCSCVCLFLERCCEVPRTTSWFYFKTTWCHCEDDFPVFSYLFKFVKLPERAPACASNTPAWHWRASWTTKRQFGLRLFCWWSQLFQALHLLRSISLSLQIS